MENVRKDIILKDETYYFDYTATGLACKSIENEIQSILETYSNIHSESSELARITNEYYENSRRGLKGLLALDDSFYLIPCGNGATAAIKRFQEIMGIYIPPATRDFLGLNIKNMDNLPLVLVSPYEHHSNEISYRQGVCETIRVSLDKNGEINFDELKEILEKNRGRKIIAAFSVASNVTGVLTDYKKLYLTIKAYGGTVLLDASSYIAYDNVDCNFYDAMVFSSHKLLGGVAGCGVLVIKKNLCKCKEPTFAAGGTVQYVNRKHEVFALDKEQLEQPGTPGIIALIRAFLAFKLRNSIGLENIRKKEKELGEYFLSKITKINDVTLYAKNVKDRLAVFSFNVKGYNPYDFASILSQNYYVETRAGCACAGPYGHDLLELDDMDFLDYDKPGWVRISIHYTHTKEDIDYLISAIKAVIKKRGKIKFSQGRYLC
ncbi:aminotransferase [Campylobacter blaseri]|uniref:Aminotransferase n=1 Tax=Campylobacter blaseri TaxID=2042961 RepID=A0A2P8R0S0_9BACT|nr:aminotransferase [Campylobacter blaseri]PSM53879.1 aminotransferase [Campylobacter blaseri]